jgi:IS30 family transposase
VNWHRHSSSSSHETKRGAFYAMPRGSNENGLIRQYLLKCTDLRGHSQDNLSEIAERLPNGPGKVLDFKTPKDVFARLVAEAQDTAARYCASG